MQQCSLQRSKRAWEQGYRNLPATTEKHILLKAQVWLNWERHVVVIGHCFGTTDTWGSNVGSILYMLLQRRILCQVSSTTCHGPDYQFLSQTFKTCWVSSSYASVTCAIITGGQWGLIIRSWWASTSIGSVTGGRWGGLHCGRSCGSISVRNCGGWQ